MRMEVLTYGKRVLMMLLMFRLILNSMEDEMLL